VYVLGNNLILNVATHGTALDKNDGKIVWKTGNKRAGYSTPWLAEINGTKSLMIFAAHDVAAVDPSNGKVQWQHPWKTSYDVNAADPIVQGNQVFISSGYDRGAALLEINGTTPKVLWENKNMRNHMNSSVLIDGHLYGIDGNSGPKATLRCVSWDKGEVKWDLPGTGSGALMAAGKTLIVLTEKGELITAEATPEKFTQISRAQVIGGKNWTVPVLANGRIYCRNSKGDVVALNVK
jgi:outer membrane protein assembly factor BamB